MAEGIGFLQNKVRPVVTRNEIYGTKWIRIIGGNIILFVT